MAEAENENAQGKYGWMSGHRRVRLILLTITAIILALVLLIWMSREMIAQSLIEKILAEYGVDATYEVEKISTTEQIIRNIRMGDQDNPDAIIDRLVVHIAPFSVPQIPKIEVTGLRLYGQQDKNGRISFGVLDPFIYTGGDDPFEWPDVTLYLNDARAHISTDYGVIGLSLNGGGHLRDGFHGEMAVVANQLGQGDCALNSPHIFSEIAIKARKTSFNGPVRIKGMYCDGADFALKNATLQLSALINSDMTGGDISLDTNIPQWQLNGVNAKKMAGTVMAKWAGDNLDIAQNWRNVTLHHPDYGQAIFSVKGEMAIGNLSDNPNIAGDLEITGNNMAIAQQWREMLGELPEQTRTIPVADIAAASVQRIMAVSKNFAVKTGLAFDFAVNDWTKGKFEPRNITIMDSKGKDVLTARKLQISLSAFPYILAGELRITDKQLPQLAIMMDNRAKNITSLIMSLPGHRRGRSHLVLDGVKMQILHHGAASFSGALALSGPIGEDGMINDLKLPFDGRWTQSHGLYVNNHCANYQFSSLKIGDIHSGKQNMRICPEQGQSAMLHYHPQKGLAISAKGDALDLAFKNGDTQFALSGDGWKFSWPEGAELQGGRLKIGNENGVTIMSRALQLRFMPEIYAKFDDAEGWIANIPIKLQKVKGDLQFADSQLHVNFDEMELEDTSDVRKIWTMMAPNTKLSLVNGHITVHGVVHEPTTQRAIVSISVMHDLSNVSGIADLDVPAITFDEALQPEMLSPFALGVVANVQGLVRGHGEILWSDGNVTSKGWARTNSLDLASAAGPANGIKGQINFVDLLNMVTEPDQIVNIAEVNPGISTKDGVVRYRILPDFKLKIEDGYWPLGGGKVRMEPMIVDMASDADRKIILHVENISAEKFIAEYNMTAVAATGDFTGTLPVIIDKDGARFEGGHLEVMGEGGSISYLGELSDYNMGYYANIAFNALRSLKYDSLTVRLDGPLDGEMVTQIKFEGIKRGDLASRNFITRQIERLPIQFNLKIEAPFMQLINSGMSLYDTRYLPSASALGILPPTAVVVKENASIERDENMLKDKE